MKRFLILCALNFALFISNPLQARIIHVPGDSSTIQGGINGAVDGDTVLVARGHYYERINFAGTAILVASNFIFDNDTTTIDSTVIDGENSGTVVVFPGYAPSASILQGFTITNGYSMESRRTYGWSGKSIITTNIMTGSYADYGDGEIHCEDSPPVITSNIITGNDGDGIYCEGYVPKITNNTTSGNFTAPGGGIYCWSAAPTIKHNIVTNNSGSGIRCQISSPTINSNNVIDNGGIGIRCEEFSSPTINDNAITGNSGGGIFCFLLSSPVIRNNVIAGNSAVYIGGICCFDYCSPVISNNTISGNFAQEYSGGGILCSNNSSPTICNNTITGNHAGDYGGGVCVTLFSSPTISGNTISGNFAGLTGGGIYCDFGSPIIMNNTISDNSAEQGGGIWCFDSSPIISNNIISNSVCGGGIACGDFTYPKIRHNDVWNNADGNFYGCPAGIGDTSWGANFNGTPCDSFYNIIRDPLFADTTDFKLLCNSPCIDAGDSSIYVPPDSGGCRIDMGAHE
ncbi:MAG: right-handed parallel beta-helix repeat-containing protein, partial [candidate division Zixibacteria bacterium]|nr:right-handed parallel beta-helix repeat-containing protein [candidate division Zixibacteria bacterium]